MNGVTPQKEILIGIFLTLALIWIDVASAAGQSRDVEEIVVKFEIPKLIEKDILIQYDGKDVYLPLIEIFRTLDIYVTADFEKGVFRGEYVTTDNKFKIDLSKRKAECSGREIKLDDREYLVNQSDLFLRPDIFDSIFALRLHFNFSELSLYLPLNKAFPAYQKLKRKADHEKLLIKKAALKDVREIPHRRENFKGGIADWALTINPLQKSGQYFSLGLGGMILGGDLSVTSTVGNPGEIKADIQRYNWHYVFNDNDYISQAEFGNIYSVGPLSRSLKGVMLTNRPEVQRKYFKTVSLSGHLGEGWEVELYINNKLTDFSYTDQNGDYNFLADIFYGSSRVMLKMYGPDGEMLIKEEFVRTPFNLIPRKTFEYTLVGGVKSIHFERKKYAQATGYYGILNSLTVGLSSDFPVAARDGEKPTVSFESTYQPFGSLLASVSHSPGNASECAFGYSRPSVLNISGSYTRFHENRFWNKFNQVSNISFSISSPLRIKRKYFSLRYRISHDRFPTYKITNMNYGFKIPLYRVHLNYFGTFKISRFTARTDRRISSQLFATTTFLRWLRPQFRLNYDHDISRLSKYGIYLHKRIFKRGQLSLSFERNVTTGSNTAMLTFNIFNGFANFTSRIHGYGQNTIVTQTQRGSVRFDQESGTFRFDRRNGLGLGSAVIWPFLDENYNGVLDLGEPLLPELRANIGGARGVRRGKGRLYYYDGLRPYDDYIVQIDAYSLDNPLLRPAHENFRITVNPNIVTCVSVPIVTAGEISGKVERKAKDTYAGIGGIRIVVKNESTGKETNITTFNDGEFLFLGLVPGMYRTYIDPEQLHNYGYASEPKELTFQIKTVEGGDIVRDLNFTLIPEN
jgi:hypothetical protein